MNTSDTNVGGREIDAMSGTRARKGLHDAVLISDVFTNEARITPSAAPAAWVIERTLVLLAR